MKRSESNSKTEPEGSLQTSVSNGCRQYYHYISGKNPSRIYIPANRKDLVHDLAQKNYNRKVFKTAEKRLKQIKKILKDYDDNEIDNLYLTQPEYLRQLITPVFPLWEERLKKWIEVPYQGRGFSPQDPIIQASNGMRVRSKSEQSIADYLLAHNIPFKYECPHYLSSYGNVYPDFTFLSKHTGEEIYWEHEGRMDDPGYVPTAIKKIESYERDRIFPGENLILTFETSKAAINNQQIKLIVNKYLS